eukprot:258873-Rhodomonas_salina.1
MPRVTRGCAAALVLWCAALRVERHALAAGCSLVLARLEAPPPAPDRDSVRHRQTQTQTEPSEMKHQ